MDYKEKWDEEMAIAEAILSIAEIMASEGKLGKPAGKIATPESIQINEVKPVKPKVIGDVAKQQVQDKMDKALEANQYTYEELEKKFYDLLGDGGKYT